MQTISIISNDDKLIQFNLAKILKSKLIEDFIAEYKTIEQISINLTYEQLSEFNRYLELKDFEKFTKNDLENVKTVANYLNYSTAHLKYPTWKIILTMSHQENYDKYNIEFDLDDINYDILGDHIKKIPEHYWIKKIALIQYDAMTNVLIAKFEYGIEDDIDVIKKSLVCMKGLRDNTKNEFSICICENIEISKLANEYFICISTDDYDMVKYNIDCIHPYIESMIFIYERYLEHII